MIGLGAELDGPQNARQPGQHVSDDLRWTIINMSVLCGLSRERITTYTGVNTRTINRIKHGHCVENLHKGLAGTYSGRV